MGATLWSLIGPYRGNAQTAMRAAQEDFFEQNYDLGFGKGVRNQNSKNGWRCERACGWPTKMPWPE